MQKHFGHQNTRRVVVRKRGNGGSNEGMSKKSRQNSTICSFQTMIDAATDPWGIDIERVEVTNSMNK